MRERIKELGFELSDAELARVFDDFKALADKKKELFDGDIEALVLKAEIGESGPWHLENLHVVSDSTRFATGRVVLRHSDGRIVTQETSGDGPVDAALKAIEQATGVFVKLRKFEVRSVTVGEDAQGEAVVTGRLQWPQLSRHERHDRHRRVRRRARSSKSSMPSSLRAVAASDAGEAPATAV